MFRQLYVLTCAAMLFLGGCTSTGSHDENPASLVTMGIDPQDLDKVASEITTEIKASMNMVPRPGQNQALVSGTPFKNDTGDASCPTGQLMQTIMNNMALTNRFVVVSPDNSAGKTTTTQQDAEQSAVAVADYTLSGIVSKVEVKQGGHHHVTYWFDFIVKSTQGGDVVLTSQSRIIKSGR